MSKGSDKGVDRFNNGYNCSQSVLISRCKEYGLDEDTALKLACSFGAGMGAIGETCGAVTGAFMLIGLKFGMSQADNPEQKVKTYQLVKEFTQVFKKKYGSVSCKDLLGYDISNQEGAQAAKEAGVFVSVCPLLVKDSVEMVEEILRKN